MEAPEVPLEQVTEHIQHQAHHHGGSGETRWVSGVALSTAIIAALAALASMMAGHSETEAMHAKMEANDQWSFYQAKSLKQHGIENTDTILTALGKEPPAKHAVDLKKYEDDKTGIEDKAHEWMKESSDYLAVHEKFAFAVTLFQISIALSAISALTKRRRYWLFSLAIGAVGLICSSYGLTQSVAIQPHHAAEASEHAGPSAHHA